MLFSKRGNLIFVTKMGDCDLNNELFATHVCKDVRDRPAKRFLTDYLIEDKQTFAVSYARRRVAVASIINVFPCNKGLWGKYPFFFAEDLLCHQMNRGFSSVFAKITIFGVSMGEMMGIHLALSCD